VKINYSLKPNLQIKQVLKKQQKSKTRAAAPQGEPQQQQQKQHEQKETETPSSAPKEVKRSPAAGLPSNVKGNDEGSSTHRDFIAVEENGNPVFVQQQKPDCKGALPL